MKSCKTEKGFSEELILANFEYFEKRSLYLAFLIKNIHMFVKRGLTGLED
jgi:hypothetical protein